jgi:hypothetical protein
LKDEDFSLDFVKERFVQITKNYQAKKGNHNPTNQPNPRSSLKPVREIDSGKRISDDKADKGTFKRGKLETNTTTTKKAKPLLEKYTKEQLEKLSTLSHEEKKRIQCKSCGEYFHDARNCKNPGKMCF